MKYQEAVVVDDGLDLVVKVGEKEIRRFNRMSNDYAHTEATRLAADLNHKAFREATLNWKPNN